MPRLPPRASPLSVLISIWRAQITRWFAGCILPRAGALRQKPGCTVTNLFGNVIKSTEIQAISAAAPEKKHGWLPLLTVLFLISYGLMTMLIVVQDRTIESQRALIRELFRDSTELSAAKVKALQDGRTQAARSAVPQKPLSQNPSIHAPSTPVPTQPQSSQAAPQPRAQIQVRPKSRLQVPSKPASDLEDTLRALITI